MFGTIMTVRRGIRQNLVESVLFCYARKKRVSTRFHEKTNQSYVFQTVYH